MLNSRYTQTYTTLNSKLNTQIHLYIHDSLQSNTVRSVQGQQGLFLFPGRDRGWWLTVIDSWVFGLGCHLWGFTIGKAFIHIQQRTLVRSLSHTQTYSVRANHTNTHRQSVLAYPLHPPHWHTYTESVWAYLVDISHVHPTGKPVWDHRNIVSGGGRKWELRGNSLTFRNSYGIFQKTSSVFVRFLWIRSFSLFFYASGWKKKDYINYSHVL